MYLSLKPTDADKIDSSYKDNNGVTIYKIKADANFYTEKISVDVSVNGVELHVTCEDINSDVNFIYQCSVDGEVWNDMYYSNNKKAELEIEESGDQKGYIREVNIVGGYRRLKFEEDSNTAGTVIILLTQGL